MKTAIVILFSFFLLPSAMGQGKPEGLFINSKAPDFKAKDQNGNEIVFKDLRKKGDVVVVFTRGSWCPYCNKFLRHLQDSLNLITAKKAQLIVITPEWHEGIDSVVAKTGASFPIIYDSAMKITNGYNGTYRVEEKIVTRYKDSNPSIDLLKINNQRKDAFLPITAVYIVNDEGSVIYRYFDEDYKKRVSVKEIVQALR
ncbi:MAG: peroxiredoxin-like family protein [Flavisolibacter sp.]